MTVPFWCVLFATALPFFVKTLLMKPMAALGHYDNHHPRDQQAKLTGWAKRAVAAQANSFESLSVFSSCVFINHMGLAPATPSAWLSVVYVVSRILYVAFYLGDRPPMRSLVWFVGLGCSFAIALLALY